VRRALLEVMRAAGVTDPQPPEDLMRLVRPGPEFLDRYPPGPGVFSAMGPLYSRTRRERAIRSTCRLPISVKTWPLPR